MTSRGDGERSGNAARRPQQVGVLGYGSIGRVVADCLAEGGVAGASLSGVTVSDGRELGRLPSLTLAELAERSDLVVEAAGQPALRDHGADLLDAGVNLLVVSMGAMADNDVFDRLVGAGPGRLHLCTGAIGGMDMVRAAAALALAVGSWDLVTGTVVADPATAVSTHIIDIEAEAGTYRFENRHAPSTTNPRSSAMVPWAVIRSLRDMCGRGWQFV